MKDKLTINGAEYHYRQFFVKEDNFWECSFVDEKDNLAQVRDRKLIVYDESLENAQKELEEIIQNDGLKFDIDNNYHPFELLGPEEKRKIKLLALKVKMEEWGEWRTCDEHYNRWRKIMKKKTGYDFDEMFYNNI